MTTLKKKNMKNRNILVAIVVATVALVVVSGLIIFNISKPKEVKTVPNKVELKNSESIPVEIPNQTPEIPKPPVFETPPVI